MTVPSALAAADRFAALLVRRRRLVLACWLVLAAALLPSLGRLRARLATGAAVPASESARVARELETRFGSPFAQVAVLVVTGAPAPDSDDGRRLLDTLARAVAAVPGVTRTLSALDAPDPLWRGRGGGTFLVAGLSPDAAGEASAEALVPHLRATTAAVGARLRAVHPGLALHWTGEAALNADLRAASAADAARAERRVLPLTLVLLLIAFGALVAALVPVLAAALAIAVTLGVVSLVAAHWPVSALVQNVAAMLGLGLGIDYALLMVGRHREALARGCAPHEAAAEAAARAGGTVLLSAATVAIGFAALLVVPLPDIRSLAVGGLLVALTSALVAVTFVPALLATLGERVNAGSLARRVADAPGFAANAARWRRWGALVARRPALVLAVAALPLLLLAWQGRRLRSTLPSGRWLPASLESARGLDALAAMGRGGVVHGVRVVLELPDGAPTLGPAGWAATRRVADALAADARVARVRALPTLVPVDVPSPLVMAMIPEHVRRSFTSADGRLAALEVVPADGVDGAALVHLVRDLRARDAAALAGLPGARLRVGGLPAVNADYQQAIAEHTPRVLALVLGATFVALLVGFRSVLVPLKAIALNLLAVGAAFGVLVLVVQDGHGAALIGLDAPLDGTFAAIPLLVFCTVFGLSMDYEVFLVSRVAEARRTARDEGAAVAEGLARTGGTITSAALLMVVVFAAFMLGDFVLMKILGLALAAAVLVDATLVRVAVAPALLVLAGRWNWWPGRPGTAAPAPAVPVPGD